MGLIIPQKFSRPISGQTEVFASKKRNNDGLWSALDGVYLQPPGTEHATSSEGAAEHNVEL